MIVNRTKRKNVLYEILGMICICFIVYESSEKTYRKEFIWMEAENAGILTEGFEISEDNDASGGKAIVNQLPSHRAGAFASYKFYIENSGKYFIWLRTSWAGGCSNTFKISIDNSNKIIIGNDNLFNKWHWLQQAEYELTRGEHRITIYNEESDTKLDKILLSSNPYYIPSNLGISSDFHINFSNGIPDFMHTKIKDSCEVRINEGASTMFIRNLDVTQSNEILFDIENNHQFVFEIILKLNNSIKKQNIGILFNFIDQSNYEKIEINNYTVKHLGSINNTERTQKVEHSGMGYLRNEYMILHLQYLYPYVNLKIDGKTILESKVTRHNNGKIGIQFNQGNLFVRSISNTTDLSAYYYENFFWTFIDELIKGTNSGIIWNIESGDWTIDHYKDVMSLEGTSKETKPAEIIFGKNFWKDYSFETALKLMSGQAGLFFNYIDTNNYYLLKLDGDKNLVSLYKACNSNIELLIETNHDLEYSEWYRINASRYKDSIYTQIDDMPLIQTTDKTFNGGKVGLWSNGFSDVNLFDDISIIQFDPKQQNETVNEHEYNFEMREKAAFDLCDWKNSGKIFKKPLRENYNGNDIVCINKETLLPSIMMNKKSFKGNFKVLWNTAPIPEDIDITIRFDIKGDNSNDSYEYIFSSHKISMIKNNKEILKKETPNIERNNIEIKYLDNKWQIISRQSSYLEIEDKLQIDKSNISFGFSGVGKGEIIIYKIKIEDNIKEEI